MELVIKIAQRIATGERKTVVCDNEDYAVRFDWDEEWDGTTPTMLVVCADGTTYTTEVKDGVALLPAVRTTRIMVGLTDGTRKATTGVQYSCIPSVKENSGIIVEPSKDVYDQLLEMYNSKLSAADLPDAVDSALAQAKESGTFDGRTPEKGVDYYTESDKEELVQAVVAALPKYGGEVENAAD